MSEPPPRKRRRWDWWFDPEWEAIVGCVLLVFSGWWWFESRGAIHESWRNILATVTVFLGPYLVHRGWTRKMDDEAELRDFLVQTATYWRERAEHFEAEASNPDRPDE